MGFFMVMNDQSDMYLTLSFIITFIAHLALFRIPDGNVILCNTGGRRNIAHPYEQTYTGVYYSVSWECAHICIVELGD